MKNLWKIFLFCIFSLVLTFANICCANDSSNLQTNNSPVIQSLPFRHAELQHPISENTFLSSNNNHKLVSSRKTKNNHFCKIHFLHEYILNRFSDNYFITLNDNNTFIKSHKISSYLKNEICTRAP